MTVRADALFEEGPVRRLLDLAIAVRDESGDPTRLREELDRFGRLVRDSPEASWTMPLATVSELLGLLADRLADPQAGAVGPDVRDRLARAAGDRPAAEFLRDLAVYFRDQDGEPSPGFDELPMNYWEVWTRFCTMDCVSYPFRSGEFTPEAAAQVVAASRHPHECHTVMAAVAAEVQRALLIFRTPQELNSALGPILTWVTHDTLQLLLRAILDHFADEH
ncbi:hypothetical protein PUR28_29590 [Streptomyces sp. BE308]|uniref:hypothetical protein n=1 Tax=Streptomyces sp. BE308 TaxID=3002529 RepID=UPI002E77B9D2|nr:hypothetical protein [Streptomyces sp. BE308]MEE1794881.1 hypothetical protein [Streptomyces sp. BE308]